MVCHLKSSVADELIKNAHILASPGKGILAADESTGTIGKRFESINVENTEKSRKAYRSLLFSTKGLGKYISGAILFEETLFQCSENGIPMIELLKKENILIGIKVDKGLAYLPGTDDEKFTMGLDTLDACCKKYYDQGARFAKWRAVLSIDIAKGKPSDLSIRETVETLAKYAAICQMNGLVPIVEPEILADGNHSIETCALITEKVLSAQIRALYKHNVLLEGCVLKPNMVTPGNDYGKWASPEEVAFYTERSIYRTIPPSLPAIFFLSGGQSEEAATLNLNAINKKLPVGDKIHPYKFSFSYGRALQASCLKAWQGKEENKLKAQDILLTRAKANSEAQLGIYTGGAGGDVAKESNFVRKYIY